jgi:DNA repair exonuclease SbcCD ATPase subunit
LESLTAKEESRAAEVLSVEEKGSDEESALRALRREAKEVQVRIEALQKVSDTCPSCGQAWTNKHAKRELAEAEERLRRVKKAVSKKKVEVEALIAEHTEATARLEKTKAKRIACQDQLVPYTLYFSISIPESAEPPEREEKFLKSQVTRLEEQIEVLSSAAMHLPNKVAYAALTEEDKELAEGEDPTDRYLEITQKVAELEVRIEDARNDAKELEETRERLTALKTKIQDKDALELLLQAFSKKGVDALRIKTVTDRLGQLVNKYAKFMFPEDYTFSFELETQFSFLVTRKYGKRVETSDVRKLSGAESLLFNLVLYVSLLSFVPASIRPSVLILDEPTSTFGPEMIDAFIKFLPVLNSVVPHIIVITPMPYVDYPGAKVFTVVKKNGVSKFVEGGVA